MFCTNVWLHDVITSKNLVYYVYETNGFLKTKIIILNKVF